MTKKITQKQFQNAIKKSQIICSLAHKEIYKEEENKIIIADNAIYNFLITLIDELDKIK